MGKYQKDGVVVGLLLGQRQQLLGVGDFRPRRPPTASPLQTVEADPVLAVLEAPHHEAHVLVGDVC